MLFSDSDVLYKKLITFFPNLVRKEDDVKNAIIKLLKLHSSNFAQNLKRLREENGISQIALANYLNVTRTSLSAWENGSHVPRLSKLARLSELLEVDVGEFFSIASITNDKTIPLFSRTDFSCINSNHFFDYMLSHAPKQTTDYFQSEYQFAFVNDDDSMIGAINNIPLKSIVFCSTEKLNCETNISDLLLSLSGSVVLLSLVKGPAVLRELSFDGTYIRLKAWNPNVLEKICLFSEEQSLPQSNEQLAMYANHPLTVSMIEVFGVAKKVIMNL